MIIFLIQIILIIIGIVGFFTYNSIFIMAGLIGLILCNVIAYLAGALKSVVGILELFYLIIAVILNIFIERGFLEILSLVFCIGEAIASIAGTIMVMLFSRYQRK